MTRKSRFKLPGVPGTLLPLSAIHGLRGTGASCPAQRGNNREPCFYGDGDYYRYLDDLREAADRNDYRLHAYVLMTSHVHVLMTPMAEHGVAHLMQDLGRKYVRYINPSYRRTGTLWEGRYKSSLIDSEAYLLVCMCYVELNPVRAGMVQHPGGLLLVKLRLQRLR